MTEPNHPITSVKLNKYCESSGDSPAGVYVRRRKDKGLDGVQCRIADDLLWVNLAEAQKWVETWNENGNLSARV